MIKEKYKIASINCSNSIRKNQFRISSYERYQKDQTNQTKISKLNILKKKKKQNVDHSQNEDW